MLDDLLHWQYHQFTLDNNLKDIPLHIFFHNTTATPNRSSYFVSQEMHHENRMTANYKRTMELALDAKII